MMRSLRIQYTLDSQDKSINIPVTYIVAEDGNQRTITCTVDDKTEETIPVWLRPFKFDIKCALIDNNYETLFSDYSTVRNLEASLFIDKATIDILLHEKELLAMTPIVMPKKRKLAKV